MQTTTTFSGNLVEDPELHCTPNGKAVVNVRVAVNHRERDTDGEWADAAPTFHNVTVWGRRAERLAEQASKGTGVMIHGAVETETWTDRNTGENRSKQIVVVSDRYGEVGLTLRSTTHRDDQD